MANACAKCGAALESAQRFCVACGSPVKDPAPMAATGYCTGCGNRVEAGSQFCIQCGTPVGAIPAESTAPSAAARGEDIASPAASPVSSPNQASSAPAAKSGGSGAKLFIGCLVAFGLAAVVVIAGVMYVGYRAKKKAEEIQQAYKSNDVGGLIHAVTGKGAAGGAAKLPDWKPASPDLLASAAGKVPMREGLVVVTAINQPLVGDYESIKSFDSTTADRVHMKYSAQMPASSGLEGMFGEPSKKSGPPPVPRKSSCGRTILRADMDSSSEYREWFCQQQEETYPGSTAVSISTATLHQLKGGGNAEFKFGVNGLQQMLQGFKKLMNGEEPGNGKKAAEPDLEMPGIPGMNASPEVSCSLHRVEPNDLAFPVLVNNQRVELPAVHAACKPADSEIETNFYFLDEAVNPLALAWQQGGSGDRLQVIKIMLPMEKSKAPTNEKPNEAAGGAGDQRGSGNAGGGGQPAQQIEQQLASNGRAQIYGIYFDFASDVLRPESDEVLKEIAQVLAQHPGWKLNVEGHTDNIGGDAFNLEVSNRRATAVKQALVTRYHIAPERLTPAGFGATRPVESNDTMEGRARNRRVELVRQ